MRFEINVKFFITETKSLGPNKVDFWFDFFKIDLEFKKFN